MTVYHDVPGLRPVVAGLEETRIVQMVQYGRGRPGLIPLWVGEGDIPTPDFIREACDKGIRDGRVFYTWQRGLPELREALGSYMTRLHATPNGAPPVLADRVTVTSSGMQGIMLTVQALVEPGDEVVVVTPVWPNVMSAVRLMGGVVVPVALDPAPEGWALDLDKLAAAIGPRTKAVFVNSPSNPTGWTLDRPALRAVWDLVQSRGVWLLADEVYTRLTYDMPVSPSFLELAGADDKLIVVNSFSKNWCMTGWRLGWLTTPPALGDALEKLVQLNTSGTAEFIQYAGLVAVEQGEPFLAEMLARCRQGRDIITRALNQVPGVTVAPPPGAFYGFLRLEGVVDSMDFARRLVDRCNVGLAPGSAFGPGGEGSLRLCFASSPTRLEEAMARLVPTLGEMLG